MGLTRQAILIVVVICIAIYAYKYYKSQNKVNDRFEILQMDIDDFNLEHLYEKSPIVFENTDLHPTNILKLLKYTYVCKKDFTIAGGDLHQTRARYTLLKPIQKTTAIIYHPIMKENVAMIIKANQYILMPMFWAIRCTDELFATALSDTASIVFNQLHRS